MRSLYIPSYLYTGGVLQHNTAVLVEDDEVYAIGQPDELRAHYPEAVEIDWSGLAMLPGTVNVHAHSFQHLLRGFVVDVPFLEWRNRALYRYAPRLDPEAIYTGALLAFGEMLHYGVTTVADFFYVHQHGTACDEAVIRAAKELGIRLVFARTMYDWPGAPDEYRETVAEAVERTHELAAKYEYDPMVTICPAPHSLHAASLEMVQAGYQLAQELGTRFHIHVAEEPFEVEETLAAHGQRPVELLNTLNVLDYSLVAVHAVWLADNEVELLGRRRAKLAYCPSSNMFLADGVTRLPELLQAGVTVGLGTDGACANNRASVFEEMRMAALVQKVHRLDATALSAEQAFAMGTRDGGVVLGMPVGEILPGYYADFVGIDLADLSLQPAPIPESALLANIVYALQPTAIDRVVVAGEEVVHSGTLQRIPESAIIERVQTLMQKWGLDKLVQ
jgi:5-methylthioadenosine/S-adenosylhomocysteine deaminase